MGDAVRLRCRYCGKPLRKDPYREGYGYCGEGVFCTLRCGYAWAVRKVGEGKP